MNSKFMALESKRRDALLNAAMKEFTANGFEGASTNVIAKEAGISKGLMFHYVDNKKDFYAFLRDYCAGILKAEYYDLLSFGEKDIFEKLRQSYLLQVELLHKHPWILAFVQSSAATKTDDPKCTSEEAGLQADCFEALFSAVDESKFREGLDITKSKQLIYWANVGFINKVLDEMKSRKSEELDYDSIVNELDGYLDELRKVFYR